MQRKPQATLDKKSKPYSLDSKTTSARKGKLLTTKYTNMLLHPKPLH